VEVGKVHKDQLPSQLTYRTARVVVDAGHRVQTSWTADRAAVVVECRDCELRVVVNQAGGIADDRQLEDLVDGDDGGGVWQDYVKDDRVTCGACGRSSHTDEVVLHKGEVYCSNACALKVR
jgi:hypothetical protein